jgi:hypothetical protein
MLNCGNPDAASAPPQEVLAIQVPGTGMVGVRVDLSQDSDPAFDAVVQIRTACATEPDTYVGTCFDDSALGLQPNAGFMAMGGTTVYAVITGYGEPADGNVSEGTYSATLYTAANAAPTLTEASAYRVGSTEFVILGTGTDPDGDASGFTFELLDAAGVATDAPIQTEFDAPQYGMTFTNARMTLALADYAPEVGTAIAAAASIRVGAIDTFSMQSTTRVIPISNATEVALGAACDATHLCAAPNDCIAGTCQTPAAVTAACSAGRAVTLTAPTGGVATVQTEVAMLAASAGALSSPECQGYGDEQVFNVTVPAGGADLIITTNLPATMADTVLAVRTTCTDASTETTCNDDYDGAPEGDFRSTLQLTAAAAGTLTVVVNSYDVLTAPESVSVEFRLRPIVAAGQPCDPAGVMNRCATVACPASGTPVCP